MLPQWKHVRVLADDTEIFVLLVFSILQYKFQGQVSKRKYNGKVIDIKATISKLGDKSRDRLALQAPGIILWYSVVPLWLRQIIRHQFDGQDGSQFEDIHGGSSRRRRVDGMNLYCGEAVESLSDLQCILFTRKRDHPRIKVSQLPKSLQLCTSNVHISKFYFGMLLTKLLLEAQPTYLCLVGKPAYGCANIASKAAVLQIVAYMWIKSSPPWSRSTGRCRSDGLPCTIMYCWCWRWRRMCKWQGCCRLGTHFLDTLFGHTFFTFILYTGTFFLFPLFFMRQFLWLAFLLVNIH